MILHSRSFALAAALSSLSLLAACGADPAPQSTSPSAAAPAPAPQQDKSVITQAMKEAVVEARREIAEGNITVSDNDDKLKAEITPKGDLLIGGQAVAIDAQQRALLLEYRGHVAALAESGMEVGVEGASIAMKAMGHALSGVLSGQSEEEIERSIESEAAGIQAAASKLCGRLPAMMASQQQLAASLPAFKPYATMTQDDIEDCMKDNDDGTTRRVDPQTGRVTVQTSANVQELAEIRDEVRNEAQEAADAATATKTPQKH